MKTLLTGLLLLGLIGCGNSGVSSNGPKVIPYSSTAPQAQPGANPQSVAPLVIRFLNRSSHVSSFEWQQSADAINEQLVNEFNPRWGTNGRVEVYTGNFDPMKATILLEDRTTGNGGETDGTNGYVAYRDNTRETWSAYCDHVAINLVGGNFLPGQSVESWDYHIDPITHKPVESAPWLLADFDFPSRHGFPGTWLDYDGNPAFDYLHKLIYP